MPYTIEIEPPLSDRTLAHGRNVMAIASVLITLAWVPGINVEDFKPFSFTFDADNWKAAWGVLAGVLSYYLIRFGMDCRTDWIPWKHDRDGRLTVIRAGNSDKGSLQQQDIDAQMQRVYRRFVWWDVGLPVVLAILGLIASGTETWGLIKQ